jgi:hypothetical protein
VNPLALYGAAGGLALVLVLGSHITGRVIGYEKAQTRCAEERSQAAQDAVEEKSKDDASQRVAASQDAVVVQRENIRLRRLLNERNQADVSDGRTCIVQSDVDGLRDDYYEIFKDRLLAGGDADGGETSP